MAKAIIKLIPNKAQLDKFNYGDYVSTWNWLAETFTGTPIECELMGVARSAEDHGIGLWFNGICIPYEWCEVTDLTGEEIEVLKEYLIKIKDPVVLKRHEHSVKLRAAERAARGEVANSTVPYDYTDIYGIVWNDAQVNRYNALQKRINEFENRSLPVPPELEMESHKAYQSPYWREVK